MVSVGVEIGILNVFDVGASVVWGDLPGEKALLEEFENGGVVFVLVCSNAEVVHDAFRSCGRSSVMLVWFRLVGCLRVNDRRVCELSSCVTVYHGVGTG